MLTQSASSPNPVDAANSAASSNGGAQGMDFYSIIFILLVSAMTIRQGTLITESKQISDNADAQNRLNDLNAAIRFSVLPPNANTAEISRVQQLNQSYAAERENLQNSLITARQVAQVDTTQASTNVNLLQQDASEDSGWLQTLNTIFQVIDQISQH